MRILLIQTAFIGDVILATALVESLHQQYPEAEIDFLLRKGNQALLKGHPYVRKVWVYDKSEQKYRNLLRLAFQVRSARYDLVVNVHRFGATGFLTAFSGAKEKIGFEKNPFSFAFSRKFPHSIGTENSQHEVDRNHQLIAELCGNEASRPRLYPSPEDWEKAQVDAPYVCMAPGSVWFTKRWPEAYWVELCKQLPAAYEVHLIGGPGERELCQRIISQSTHPRLRNRAGELNLLASAALMAKASMNFVNDSAPLHLASAMNAPVTAVFCSTVPAFGFGPLSDQHVIAETSHNLDCRPCGLHGKSACPQGHFRCSDIAPASLLTASSLH